MQLSDRIPILLDPLCLDYSLLPASQFFWRDACLLRTWNWFAYPTDEQMENIMLVTGKLSQISAFFNSDIEIVSWLRPPQYNQAIGGTKNSAHLDGAAVDFRVKDVECDVVRMRLKSELERLDIRMESLDGSSWIHIDIRNPENGVRFFKP